jgi:hypothetical protein
MVPRLVVDAVLMTLCWASIWHLTSGLPSFKVALLSDAMRLQVYDLYNQGLGGLSWGVSTGWESVDSCYKVSRWHQQQQQQQPPQHDKCKPGCHR